MFTAWCDFAFPCDLRSSTAVGIRIKFKQQETAAVNCKKPNDTHETIMDLIQVKSEQTLL